MVADSLRSEQSIEQIYQKKTQLEHILLRPDTYVGSADRHVHETYVFDEVLGAIVHKKITYSPALYKIFDEILVNAADNMRRDPDGMDLIDVTIDVDQGHISILNNGRSIPVQMHKEYKCFVPELVFGHLLTSDNYNDGSRSTVGGRNGYGAKLTNVFSKKFIVEAADDDAKKQFKQTFEINMTKKSKPQLTDYSGKPHTRITFWPDLERFGMSGFDDDIVALFTKRVYDIAGSADGCCRVILNGKQLSISSFKEYVDLYLTDCGKNEKPRSCLHERCSDRWEVALHVNEGSFQQVSLVNAICTSRGGAHVSHVTEQLVEAILKAVRAKNRGGIEIKPSHVKNHLWVFVRCLIENPAFDSQAKEMLTTKSANFGSACELSDRLIRQVVKSGIVESILDRARARQREAMGKSLQGLGNQTRVHGIPKLEDANDAGGLYSQHCTLILTEGDSAKALAVAGLSVVGRDRYGVFPLKGKVLNVRDATYKQVMGNSEIQNLLRTIGLDTRVPYTSTSGLRYGHIMLMTDQDHDGSHIKGLLINLFHHWWPSLLQVDGFLQDFQTPLVKVWRDGPSPQQKSFLSVSEYVDFRKKIEGQNGWKAKYYKGLGTSTSKEAKEYFRNIKTSTRNFRWKDTDDGEAIDLAFNKKRADDRKDWINGAANVAHVDFQRSSVRYSDFIHKELVHFAKYDVSRSIPSVVDGFKPSQRKVIFCAFKKRLHSEIKVSQFVGYVSEQSAYHHGEAALENTIVNLASNYVGTNNVNLLLPCGQFGTRLQGGKDRAAARYIHTKLAPVARALFHVDDDALLDFLEEEGQHIEPKWYCPVIPSVLVNGADGIGVGWSTSVPNYNPRDIIANIRRMLRGEALQPMTPWYRGFKGSISPSDRGETSKFDVSGLIAKSSDQTGARPMLEITELPIKVWTQSYKDFLQDSMPSQTSEDGQCGHLIEDFREYHTESSVHFAVALTEAKLAEVENQGLEKTFKLRSSVSIANMVLFDAEGKLSKYESPLDILQDFCKLRREMYVRRRDHMISVLMREADVLSNKARFILMVVNGELELRGRKQKDLLKDLQALGFLRMSSGEASGSSSIGAKHGNGEEETETDEKGYNYLLGMNLWSLTFEQVEEIQRQREKTIQDLENLRKTSIEEIWERDLQRLSEALDELDIGGSIDSEASAGHRKEQGFASSTASFTTVSKPDAPGVYRPGESVRYWSKTAEKWFTATVLSVNEDGSYDLNLKKRAQAQNICRSGEEVEGGPHLEANSSLAQSAEETPCFDDAAAAAAQKEVLATEAETPQGVAALPEQSKQPPKRCRAASAGVRGGGARGRGAAADNSSNAAVCEASDAEVGLGSARGASRGRGGQRGRAGNPKRQTKLPAADSMGSTVGEDVGPTPTVAAASGRGRGRGRGRDQQKRGQATDPGGAAPQAAKKQRAAKK